MLILNIVKKLVKLALFFSLSFIIVFIGAAGFRYLSLRIDWVQQIPQKPETFLSIFLPAAHWALSLSIYASICLSLSYAARRKIFSPFAFLCIVIFSLVFSTGFSSALFHFNSMPSEPAEKIVLGEKGLLLYYPGSSETAVVLLDGLENPFGPRVTINENKPLVFQSTAVAEIPPVRFGGDVPWSIDRLYRDINLNSIQLKNRFEEGLYPYLIYLAALIFLLSSFGFLLKISVWPLAGLFLGILTFRGILAIETFLNSNEVMEFYELIFKTIIPVTLIVPIIFAGFALLLNIYSVLVYASKRLGKDEY